MRASLAVAAFTTLTGIAVAEGGPPNKEGTPIPKFDVVSIHAVPPNAPQIVKDIDFAAVLPGGRYIDPRA